MSPYLFYEPFYLQIERILNDPSLSKQDRKAGCNGEQCAPVVRSFKPRLDVHEDIEKNIVTANFEFPGFSMDEVQINFQNGKLTVCAETKKSEDHAETGYTLRERLRGKLSRTLQLPEGVQEEHIKATLKNGLLTVTFPKSLPELAPKKIVIQTSKSDKEEYDTDFNL